MDPKRLPFKTVSDKHLLTINIHESMFCGFKMGQTKYKALRTRDFLSRAYSRNLGQRLVLARKGTFFNKRPQKFHPAPYSIPFLSALHQNKVLHNFRRRGQRSILECNIGLEYVLLRFSARNCSLHEEHVFFL